MMVATVATGSHIYTVDGDGYAPEGAIRFGEAERTAESDPILPEIARAAALCNDAVLHANDTGWRVEGDPMEGALQALAGKIMRTGTEAFAGWTRTDSIPFDASHRYMAVLHHDHEGHASINV
jgi:magnesium-transporting ATPase (P-type)